MLSLVYITQTPKDTSWYIRPIKEKKNLWYFPHNI